MVEKHNIRYCLLAMVVCTIIYLHHSICYQLEGSLLGNIEVCSSEGQNDTSTEEE